MTDPHILPDSYSPRIPDRTVRVTDAPFRASGDGRTECREAIQRAIDETARQGGGRVVLPAGGTYLSAPLFLKSHVELHLEEGAVLQQTEDDAQYVRPSADGYERYQPRHGHNYSPEIRWSHCWYWNYPMIYAGAGTHDIAVTGPGTLRMMDKTSEETCIKVCPVGFYQVSDFLIADITITNYHSYAMMPYTCTRGMIRNVRVDGCTCGNGDGVSLMNSRDIRVTGCDMDTDDDTVYVFSSYRDPRGGTWWSSDFPQASENIEVDHNSLRSNCCKSFGMILWGIDCPDLEKVEVRNIYVHDNYLQYVGNWLYCPYTENRNPPPVTTVRFENNRIDAIEWNFFETEVSDMSHFHSMSQMKNVRFRDGRCFWAMRTAEGVPSAGVIRQADGTAYGYLDRLDEGDAALYQGVFIRGGQICSLLGNVCTSGVVCRLFVRKADTGEVVASQEFSNTEYAFVSLAFTAPEDGNYHVGMEKAEDAPGWAKAARLELLGNNDRAFGYRAVKDVYNNGKVLYFRTDDTTYVRRTYD